MENNNDNDINRYNDNYEKGITQLYEEKELKIKWHKEILENQSMQEHFKDFHPSTIDTFIMYYLSEKYLAYKYADSYERRVQEKRSRWIDAAHEHLQFIQHKKLFDLQCQWRAEQITLNQVEIVFDFTVWGKDILNCPFLEPISKDDIKIYKEFLLSTDTDYRDLEDTYELQNYEEYKENYLGSDNDGLCLPDWYEYHNLRTGNSALLILPDTRGEKEDFYISLLQKDLNKDAPLQPPYVPDDRPHLSTYDLEKITFFVTTFEDEETRKKYANYSEISKKNRNENFDLSELIMSMEEEDEYIPIEAHYNFREALFRAYNTFILKKIAEYMSLAHEQYLFNRKMGFTFETEGNRDQFYRDLRNKYLEMILEGRELNGEERNLDF